MSNITLEIENNNTVVEISVSAPTLTADYVTVDSYTTLEGTNAQEIIEELTDRLIYLEGTVIQLEH